MFHPGHVHGTFGDLAKLLEDRAIELLDAGFSKSGLAQAISHRSPHIYSPDAKPDSGLQVPVSQHLPVTTEAAIRNCQTMLQGQCLKVLKGYHRTR